MNESINAEWTNDFFKWVSESLTVDIPGLFSSLTWSWFVSWIWFLVSVSFAPNLTFYSPLNPFIWSKTPYSPWCSIFDFCLNQTESGCSSSFTGSIWPLTSNVKAWPVVNRFPNLEIGLWGTAECTFFSALPLIILINKVLLLRITDRIILAWKTIIVI